MVVRDGERTARKRPLSTDVAMSYEGRETRCLMATQGLDIEVTP